MSADQKVLGRWIVDVQPVLWITDSNQKANISQKNFLCVNHFRTGSKYLDCQLLPKT
jgi:hypothetical protein